MKKKLLSDKQREEIRQNYKGRNGEIDELAQKYGVSRSTISRAVRPDQAHTEREQRRQYMAERYGAQKDYYNFRIVVDPAKEPEIYEKLTELERSGVVGARQNYIRELIKKDIQSDK